jgi:hypothetical protein
MPKLLCAGVAIVILAGCSDSLSGPGGGNTAPPEETTPTPQVTIPPNARVVQRQSGRGENPSHQLGTETLKAPLPPLYLRVTTNPPARITVTGTILCQDLNTGGSVQSDVPFTTGDGELVVAIHNPRGAKPGWECSPIISWSAQTDPGKVTLAVAELLAGP